MYKRGIIYLDDNQCPKCTGKLVLVSVEKSVTELNKDGLPIIDNNIDDEVDIFLICKDCKKPYEVEKRGMYFGIKRDLFVQKDIEDFNPFSI